MYQDFEGFSILTIRSDYSDYTPFARVSIKIRPPAQSRLHDYGQLARVCQDFEGLGILTMGSDYSDYSLNARVFLKILPPAES